MPVNHSNNDIVIVGGHGAIIADITTWGQVGATGEWASKPISLYGRNSASGTYGFFKEKALFGGDYKDTVKEQPGSSSVVQAVASDRYGIGYSGIGYATYNVLVRKAEEWPVPIKSLAAVGGTVTTRVEPPHGHVLRVAVG